MIIMIKRNNNITFARVIRRGNEIIGVIKILNITIKVPWKLPPPPYYYHYL